MGEETASAPGARESVIGGKYRVIRLLGKGGMGGVYEAENTWTKRRVALKLMSPNVADQAMFVRRFMQEAQTAAQLSHPNIVDVLDMGQDEATREIFIVQELLQGRDLGHRLEAAGPLSTGEALDLLVPVMEALVMAHARGVVHRDLKPDNIFLAETARGVVPTLIDFGIAKVIDDEAGANRTGTGVLMGTPYYMSPEQARGETTLDARSDVWSLGVVLYEMLSGKRPFAAANANALIAKIIYESPTPLALAAPDLPPALADVVMRAVEPDLARRHASMQSFLDALRAVDGRALSPSLPSAPPASLPPSVVPSVVREAPPAAQTFAPVTAPASPRRPRRAAALALAAVAVALGLVVARVAAHRAPATATPTTAVRLPVTAVTPVAPAIVANPVPEAPIPVADDAAQTDAGVAVGRRVAARRQGSRPPAPARHHPRPSIPLE